MQKLIFILIAVGIVAIAAFFVLRNPGWKPPFQADDQTAGQTAETVNGGSGAGDESADDHGHEHAGHDHSGSQNIIEDETSAIELNESTTIADLIAIANGNDPTRATEAVLEIGERQPDESEIEAVSIQLARSCMHEDELVRIAAEEATRSIGPVVAEHIGPLVNPDEPNDYASACSIIRALGTDAKQWMPQLIDGLNHEDVAVRRMALFGMDKMGTEAMPAIDRLIELLDDENFNNQVGVCQVLEGMGREAVPAEKRLLQLIEEGNLSARSWGLIALGAIGPTADSDPAAIIAERLDAFSQPEKERALMGLANLGPDASRFTAEVEAMMTDTNKRCMPWAAYTYWKITGEPEKPIEILRGFLNDETYRRAALERLSAMGPIAADTRADIVSNLPSAEADVRELSMLALKSFGPAAADQAEALKPFLDDEDVIVRYYAKKAIAAIEEK